MSYYILPKININYVLKPTIYGVMDKLHPHISSSLIHYVNESEKVLQSQFEIEANSSVSLKTLHQIVHNYDFLFSCVSGSDAPVTNVEARHPIYFDITEMYQTLKLDEQLPKNSCYILCCGKNSSSASHAINTQRIEMNDNIYTLDQYKSYNNLQLYSCARSVLEYYDNFKGSENFKKNCHFIYFEEGERLFQDTNDYLLYLVKSILVLDEYITTGGCMILKINTIFYKPIIDLIYIISHMFQKIYIMKPNSSNVMLDERYLVCKSFVGIQHGITESLHTMYNSLFPVKNDIVVGSFIENKIHYYFLNKLEESNVIIGQQKLDACSQLISLLKSKNKIEKIEIIQKHNVQKCIYWCEKHKVSYHKTTEKSSNIFLPTKSMLLNQPDVNDDEELDLDNMFYSYLIKNYSIEDYSDSEDENDDLDIIKFEKIPQKTRKKA